MINVSEELFFNTNLCSRSNVITGGNWGTKRRPAKFGRAKL